MPLNIGPQTDVVIMPDNLAYILPIVIYRQKLSNLQDQIRQLQSEANALIDEMINECPHPIDKIVEAAEIPEGNTLESGDPFRVCSVCGYAEDGWGVGFYKLGKGIGSDYCWPRKRDNTIEIVNRQEAENLVVKRVSEYELRYMMRNGK